MAPVTASASRCTRTRESHAGARSGRAADDTRRSRQAWSSQSSRAPISRLGWRAHRRRRARDRDRRRGADARHDGVDGALRLDLDQLKRILDLVREHDLSEFEIEHDGLRLKIRKQASVAQLGASTPCPAPDPPCRRASNRLRQPPSRLRRPRLRQAVRRWRPRRRATSSSPWSSRRSWAPSSDRRSRRSVVCRDRLRRQEGRRSLHHRGDETDERDRLGVRGEIVNIYIENGQPVQYGERLFAIRTA